MMLTVHISFIFKGISSLYRQNYIDLNIIHDIMYRIFEPKSIAIHGI